MRFLPTVLALSTLAALLPGCGASHALSGSAAAIQALEAQSAKKHTYALGCSLDGLSKMTDSASLLSSLPAKVDLRDGCSPIRDQGHTEGCVAFATVCGLGEFITKKQGHAQLLSPRFLWALTRKQEHSLDKNQGTYPTDAAKLAREIGFVAESDFPMDAGITEAMPNFNDVITQAPDSTLIASAKKKRLMTGVQPVQSIHAMKQSLADGLPVVIAIAVLPSFENTGSDGVVPMPKASEESLGGHALTCVGYDNDAERFIIRNSWGTKWGDKGYCYLPYDYVRKGLTNVYQGFTAKL